MAVIRLGNLLWRPHTRPISPEDPVDVKDVNTADIKAKLEQVRQLLSGVATENKLEQARTLLDAISTKDFATSSKQDALNIAVEDLKSELILVKSELANIKANQLSGDQKVQLSGTTMELYGVIVADRPPADTVLAGATFTIVDESGYFQTWISDGTKWVEV